MLDHEWLPAAKRLNVGQSRRIKHTCPGSPSLVIRHLPDRYTGWCYRCKEHGVHKKKHVLLGQDTHTASADTMPTDAVKVSRDCAIELYARHLRKSLPWYVDQCTEWYYSRKHNRVILSVQGGYLGRSLDPSIPGGKWCVYAGPTGYPALGLLSQLNYKYTDRIVLTEDILSAHKVTHAFGNEAGHRTFGAAVLGTKLTTTALHSLLELAPESVLVFYDGDTAGRSGAQATLRRLRGLGINARNVECPLGFDPKDLDIRDIVDLLE